MGCELASGCTRRSASARVDPWLAGLLKRKPPKLAAVALVNKMARIAWKLLTGGEDYNPTYACPAKAAAGL
jgi:transposase